MLTMKDFPNESSLFFHWHFRSNLMAESSAIGASVEGEKISLQTRKFEPYPPKVDSKLKTLKFRFKLGMNGRAEVTEAYLSPHTSCHWSTSMTNVGDRINGTVISGWSSKPLGKPNISKGSGTHSASYVDIKGGCAAEVEQSPREQMESVDFQRRNPQVIQKLTGSTQSD